MVSNYFGAAHQPEGRARRARPCLTLLGRFGRRGGLDFDFCCGISGGDFEKGPAGAFCMENAGVGIEPADRVAGEAPVDRRRVAEREADGVFKSDSGHRNRNGFSRLDPNGLGGVDPVEEGDDAVGDFAACDGDDQVMEKTAVLRGEVKGAAGTGGGQVANAVVETAVKAVDVSLKYEYVAAGFAPAGHQGLKEAGFERIGPCRSCAWKRIDQRRVQRDEQMLVFAGLFQFLSQPRPLFRFGNAKAGARGVEKEEA